MRHRVWNFSAGPGILPVSVLEHARDELLAHADVGASVLELSHRSRAFEAVIAEAERNLRELLRVPPTHQVVFLQGGASLQFSMVPMNLLRSSATPAAYVLTGSWSKKALAEARREGEAAVAWDGEPTGFRTVPDSLEGLGHGAAYLHVTSNETIEGVQLGSGFEPADGTPLVCDASSDFLSRPIRVERYGLLYAGAQKNAGPAGLTVVIVREDVLARIPDGLPTMLDYRTHVEHRSRYNTPPTFAVYVLALVTGWIQDEIGGLEPMLARNREKATLLYEAIDASEGFYRGHAAPAARSLMNVTFRLPSKELEEAFVAQAAAADLIELRGHRSVGGIRASIYNAMPIEGVRALRGFMEGFASRHA
ncbi:MAG TPA: 3-phosphoserine/phosphohydroxythreonine transaminase [Actinomycetota bacterium]|nr:3-phosphoserine/phosphohydroxythreonine transaminase [Actinomycetota bacterium]